jgi:hypothetical protein
MARLKQVSETVMETAPVLALLILLAMAIAAPAVAVDARDLRFEEPRTIGMAKTRYYKGRFASKPQYTAWGLEVPVSFITPAEDCFSSDDPARLVVYLHPYDNGGGHWVEKPWQVAQPRTTVELRNQEDGYQEGIGGWWGYTGGQAGRVGNYNGERIAASVDYVLQAFGDKIDIGQGIVLRGKSLGGTGAILQSMILPRHSDHIAIVDAMTPNMLFVKCCMDKVARSWAGQATTAVDFRVQAPNRKNIHYFLNAGSNDNLGIFDLEFFEICERERISCAGTWLRGGHASTEKGYTLSTKLFMDSNQDARLDQILPVVTRFSGNNHDAQRGHHNRGISWDQSGMVDSAHSVRIPLKYMAMKDLGEGMPDQPDRVTFTVTPRRIHEFSLLPGQRIDWLFGEQSGQLVVPEDGLLTIPNLALQSADRYTLLVLSRSLH